MRNTEAVELEVSLSVAANDPRIPGTNHCRFIEWPLTELELSGKQACFGCVMTCTKQLYNYAHLECPIWKVQEAAGVNHEPLY